MNLDSISSASPLAALAAPSSPRPSLTPTDDSRPRSGSVVQPEPRSPSDAPFVSEYQRVGVNLDKHFVPEPAFAARLAGSPRPVTTEREMVASIENMLDCAQSQPVSIRQICENTLSQLGGVAHQINDAPYLLEGLRNLLQEVDAEGFAPSSIRRLRDYLACGRACPDLSKAIEQVALALCANRLMRVRKEERSAYITELNILSTWGAHSRRALPFMRSLAQTILHSRIDEEREFEAVLWAAQQFAPAELALPDGWQAVNPKLRQALAGYLMEKAVGRNPNRDTAFALAFTLAPIASVEQALHLMSQGDQTRGIRLGIAEWIARHKTDDHDSTLPALQCLYEARDTGDDEEGDYLLPEHYSSPETRQRTAVIAFLADPDGVHPTTRECVAAWDWLPPMLAALRSNWPPRDSEAMAISNAITATIGNSVWDGNNVVQVGEKQVPMPLNLAKLSAFLAYPPAGEDWDYLMSVVQRLTPA